MSSTTAPRSIVVGIDGSAQSAAALRWAVDLASTTDATITAVTTWAVPVSGAGEMWTADSVKLFEEAAHARVNHAIAAIETSIEITPSVQSGSAGHRLVELSHTNDLVVVGRSGKGWVARALLGSTARHVARHAACPVAIIGSSEQVEPHAIVAVDGSARSVGALSWALALDGLRVTAVYAHDERPLEELPRDHALRRELEGAGEALLKRVVDATAADVGVDASAVATEVRNGDPRSTIVDDLPQDALLLVGGRGDSGFPGMLVGSLADYAMGHATRTLIIWHRQDDAIST